MDSRSRPDIRCLWQIFKQATSSSTIELLCRCEHVADEQTMRRLDDMINRNRSNYIKQMRNSFREHQKATRLAKLNPPSTTTLPQTKKKKKQTKYTPTNSTLRQQSVKTCHFWCNEIHFSQMPRQSSGCLQWPEINECDRLKVDYCDSGGRAIEELIGKSRVEILSRN